MFKVYDNLGNEIEDLKNHLLTSSTIATQSLVTAEWNLNIIDNIEEIGNYRYRPSDNLSSFYTLPSSFIKETAYSETAKYYGATDADIVLDGGYDKDDTQLYLTEPNQKNKFYFSLEDCFNRFRPRSGINKAVFPGAKGIRFGHFLTENLAKRPRYYLTNKKDLFKYWTSYRTEVVNNQEVIRGYSNASAGENNGYYIDDAAPFVVYKEAFASNRIIIKMQTHVGEPTSPVTPNDPFTGTASVPKKWRVDTLDASNNWSTAITLNSYSINNDGYVELVYGLVIPSQYQERFVHAGEYASSGSLPSESIDGYAYLVGGTTYHIWQDSVSAYQTFSATLAWQTTESLIERVKPYVTKLIGSSSTTNAYSLIKGVRVAVETMKKTRVTFDLIEISPRLAADLSDRTISYSIDKKAGDLASTGIPSGTILASTGSISIFDYDQAFDKGNTNSIINKFLFKNLQFKFYQKILNVNGLDYVVPIKTMYVDGFPQTSYAERTIDISLRDLFFYFEAMTSPLLFLRNKSLKYIICLLMDAIGFSNYDFKYVANEKDVKIPNFFVGPDKSLAEVLQDLCLSTQSSMFFDEDNNLVIMSKRYLMPEDSSVRPTDIILSGSPDQKIDGVLENALSLENGVTQISNIIQIEGENHEIYNDGKIVFSNKYIQKNVADLDQVAKLDYEKTYTYQPVLLWELSATSTNENLEQVATENSSYVLSAVTLNTNLSSTIPFIQDNQIKNNIINVGEMVYWLNNYSGYLMANGEIIKYDAKEYRVAGFADPVWVSSQSDRDYYFSKVPYGGQMKATGNIRIYTEVSYKENGELDKVVKNGRGQFGTKIVSHSAGLDSYWSDGRNRFGAVMDFEYLNGKKKIADAGTLYNPSYSSISFYNSQTLTYLVAGKGILKESMGLLRSDEDGQGNVNGVIANYLSSAYTSETKYLSSTRNLGTVQSSALVFTGNQDYIKTNSLNLISYVYKELEKVPKIVGTRMRIMGSQTKDKNSPQLPFGEMTFLNSQEIKINDKAEKLNISGASGGIGIIVNPTTNAGYYFEIAALSSYLSENDSNVWFYKLTRQGYPNFTDNSSAKLQAENNPDNPNTLIASSNQSLNAGSRVKNRSTGDVATNIAVDDRILVQNAPIDYQNGYFKVVKVGGASEKWELERDELAIPKLLFSSKADILVDYSSMIGSSKIVPTETVPVYDLKIEVFTKGQNELVFYLYINDVFIGSATDKDADCDKVHSSVVLLNRGTSKCMFEHIYAISEKDVLATPPKVFGLGQDSVNLTDRFKNYRLNKSIVTNYLSNINNSGPQSDLIYDEFGTILRECAYFNIRYDKAYPALLAKVANNFNPLLGYFVSNFTPSPYGAEFFVFNTTDAPLVMDSSTGNYLRINGVTFTAESNEELTVDDYFNLLGDYSQYSTSSLSQNISNVQNDLALIKNSRNTYGRKEFVIEAPYIQDRDTATSMMDWMIQKIKKPKLALSVELFSLPTIQLGDIVEIQYQSNNNIDIPASSRFVVYCINNSVSDGEINQTIYVSEVV